MRPSFGLFRSCVFVCMLMAVLVQSASASIELKGTLPGGTKPVVIINAQGQSGLTGILKFKFSAPGTGAYALSFCIGPASNPCGLPTSFVVNVPAGQERLAVIDAHVLATNVLVVAQGTTSVVPFAVTME